MTRFRQFQRTHSQYLGMYLWGMGMLELAAFILNGGRL